MEVDKRECAHIYLNSFGFSNMILVICINVTYLHISKVIDHFLFNLSILCNKT